MGPAMLASLGAFLWWTAVAYGWRGLGFGPKRTAPRQRAATVERWLSEAGLHEVRPLELAGVMSGLAAIGGLLGWAMFGAPLPAVLASGCAAATPILAHQRRRALRRHAAHEAWPRLIEEVRILTGASGRSVPQALFEAGDHGPPEVQRAMDLARHEWLMTTDFASTTVLLKQLLADASADATLETLLVAHEVGAGDLDERLIALAEDRTQDLDARRDAEAEQSGVRFARRFVLVVPVGMALVGLSIGPGRAAYATPSGQLATAAGILVVAACWVWAGRIMRLPEPSRVLGR